MGETGPTLEFPSLQNIIDLNRRIIHETGGNLDAAGRLRNEDSLRWVLEIIRYPPFSGGPYQTISEKAAVLAWTIIRSHVFIDGNKRTGMFAMMAFLRLNGFYIQAREQQLIEVTLKVANARAEGYTREDFTEWVGDHLSTLMPGY